ncbi:MAG: ABC transporter ATP-binding protein [Betaproteobacteria bacterium]|nr:MAG: ABC transporter ATP-binding protein [Betaproteobacteria bacterium]
MHMAPGDSTRPALIRMLGVAKSYRTAEGEVESLQPLEFDIREGEFLSIVGPSGCGKSTLLKLVGGLLPATRGSIEIAGKRVEGPAGSIGIVFQNHVLLAWRTVLENIMLQIEVRKLPHGRGLEHARELVEMVGLKGFENKYPWQLSGGMQQRASICRALVHDPAILLMDEPFGALDAMTREKMNLELQRIWSAAKKTVLLITHSIPESIFLSDRVLVMSERPGSIAGIYDVPLPRPRTLAMMGGVEFGALAQKIRAHFYAQGSLDA